MSIDKQVRDILINDLKRFRYKKSEPEKSVCPHIVTSNEGTSYCRLAETNGAKPAAVPDELLNALEDLSFACFGVIDTRAPSLAVYNRTFGVLEKYRKIAAAQEAQPAPAQNQEPSVNGQYTETELLQIAEQAIKGMLGTARTMAEAYLSVLGRITSGGWLVWSNEHEAWWGPNRAGYYTDINSAGRYSLSEAESCARTRSQEDGEPPTEVVVPSPELMAALLKV